MRALALTVVLAACIARAQEAPPPEPPTPTTSGELSPDAQFQRGKNLFDYADCANAIPTLAPLAVPPPKLKDDNDQKKVHQMLGVCYALNNKPVEAAIEFSALLALDPDYDLDAFHNPPAAVDIFTRQRDAMRAQLADLRRERAKQSAQEPKTGYVVERNTVVRDVPIAVAFMPFGLAQAANGETALAVVIGATQGLTLATSVVTFYASTLGYLGQEGVRRTPAEAAAQKSTYTGLVVTEGIAALAFAATYGVGVGEALWNREDRVVIEKKESKRVLTPEEIAALKNVPTTP